MPTYTRAIDYEAKSSKEELTRRQGNYPPQGGGGTPIRGEQRQSFMVSDNYAWNLQGTSPVPAFGAAEQRGLEIWRSPHGFVKAGLAASNPTAFTRIEDDVPYTIVTFQYTDVPDHYIDYKDFGGVQFPARVHHHQGDAHVRLAAHGLYDLRAAVLSSAGLLCLAPLRVRFNCPRAMVKRP
jgi:hypothetical protein